MECEEQIYFDIQHLKNELWENHKIKLEILHKIYEVMNMDDQLH